MNKQIGTALLPKAWNRSVFVYFVWSLSSHSIIYHSYGDVAIAGEGLQMLTYARHSWPLSSEGSLTCHTLCDTGLPFIMVISRTRDHRHLFHTWATLTNKARYLNRDRTPLASMAYISIIFLFTLIQCTCILDLVGSIGYVSHWQYILSSWHGV